MESIPTFHLPVMHNVVHDRINVLACPSCGKKLAVGKLACTSKCKANTLAVLNLSKEFIGKLNARIALFVYTDSLISILAFNEKDNYAACFESECKETSEILDNLKSLIFKLNDEWHQLIGQLRSNRLVQDHFFKIYGKHVNTNELLKAKSKSNTIPKEIIFACKHLGIGAENLELPQTAQLLKKYFRLKV